jgi:hypothetical protein
MRNPLLLARVKERRDYSHDEDHDLLSISREMAMA